MADQEEDSRSNLPAVVESEDLDSMFARVGQKLGWFDSGGPEAALEKLMQTPSSFPAKAKTTVKKKKVKGKGKRELNTKCGTESTYQPLTSHSAFIQRKCLKDMPPSIEATSAENQTPDSENFLSSQLSNSGNRKSAAASGSYLALISGNSLTECTDDRCSRLPLSESYTSKNLDRSTPELSQRYLGFDLSEDGELGIPIEGKRSSNRPASSLSSEVSKTCKGTYTDFKDNIEKILSPISPVSLIGSDGERKSYEDEVFISSNASTPHQKNKVSNLDRNMSEVGDLKAAETFSLDNSSDVKSRERKSEAFSENQADRVVIKGGSNLTVSGEFDSDSFKQPETLDSLKGTDQYKSYREVKYNSSDSEEDFENFLSKLKTPAKSSSDTCKRGKHSDSSFVVPDHELDDSGSDIEYLGEEGGAFYRNVDRLSSPRSQPVCTADDLISSDDSLPDISTPPKCVENKPVFKTPAQRPKPSLCDRLSSTAPRPASTRTFLASLATDVHSKHPQAQRLCDRFKRRPSELTQYLFEYYNRTVFENKFPSDIVIEWNKRLLKTAGYCKAYRRNGVPGVEIQLSTKVCDSPERVRDTLIHELCHAAVWLFHGIHGGHGQLWKMWSRKANMIHPELPSIARCHSYSINCKYTYMCVMCQQSYGRHSKSIDTTKKRCGRCHGRLELTETGSSSKTPATPRTPSAFALHVKHNYSAARTPGTSHADAMKRLASDFAKAKLNPS